MLTIWRQTQKEDSVNESDMCKVIKSDDVIINKNSEEM